MKAILKREFASYFNTLTGWIFVAALLAFTGIYFMILNLFQGSAFFASTLDQIRYIFLITVPILTMRCFAEERRMQTDQLLLTAPVTEEDIVLGKYGALLCVLAIPMGISCLCPLIIRLCGSAFLGADYAAIGMFFLLGAAQLAVGMLISALTGSQLIAAGLSFCALLLLYLWDGLVEYLPVSAVGSLIGLLIVLLLLTALFYAISRNRRMAAGLLAGGSVLLVGWYFLDTRRFAGMLPDALKLFSLHAAFHTAATEHILDIRGVLLYLTVIIMAVMLTVTAVRSRRWN